MIEQAYVKSGDQPAPTVEALRKRIAQAVDATTGTALERLVYWLQMPTKSAFPKMMDNDCQVRAKRVGAALSPAEEGLKVPADLAGAIGVADRWDGIVKALKADQAVYVNGSTGHVGGGLSLFRNKDDIGFHVIVFLGVGKDSDERLYFLGLDPDVSGTKETREKWQSLVDGDTKEEAEKLTGAQGGDLVKAMVLGDSKDGFGPLVRKYYVDTAKAFPKIKRF